MNWKESALHELEQASSARTSGNEGRARVCARRAAGYIAAEYFRRNSLPDPGASAYSRLVSLLSLPDLPPAGRERIDHFVMRTTPEFKLPVEADLVAETYELADILLNETLDG